MSKELPLKLGGVDDRDGDDFLVKRPKPSEEPENASQAIEVLVINPELFVETVNIEKDARFNQEYNEVLAKIDSLNESLRDESAENEAAKLSYILVGELNKLFSAPDPLSSHQNKDFVNFLESLAAFVKDHAQANSGMVKKFSKSLIKTAFFLTHDEVGQPISDEDKRDICQIFVATINITRCLGGAISSVENIFPKPPFVQMAQSSFDEQFLYSCREGDQAHLPAAFKYLLGKEVGDSMFRNPLFDFPLDYLDRLIKQVIIFDVKLLIPALSRKYYDLMDEVGKSEDVKEVKKAREARKAAEVDLLGDEDGDQDDEIMVINQYTDGALSLVEGVVENILLTKLKELSHVECFDAKPKKRGEAFSRLMQSRFAEIKNNPNFSLIEIDKEKLDLAAKFLLFIFLNKPVPTNITGKISVAEVLGILRNEELKNYLQREDVVDLFTIGAAKLAACDVDIARNIELLQRSDVSNEEEIKHKMKLLQAKLLSVKFRNGGIATSAELEGLLEGFPKEFNADDGRVIQMGDRSAIKRRFVRGVAKKSIELEWLLAYGGNIPDEVISFLTKEINLPKVYILKCLLILNDFHYVGQNIDLLEEAFDDEDFVRKINIVQVSNLFRAIDDSSPVQYGDIDIGDYKINLKMILLEKRLQEYGVEKTVLENIISNPHTLKMFGYEDVSEFIVSELIAPSNTFEFLFNEELCSKLSAKHIHDVVAILNAKKELSDDGKKKVSFFAMTTEIEGEETIIKKAFRSEKVRKLFGCNDLKSFVKHYFSLTGAEIFLNYSEEVSINCFEKPIEIAVDILKFYIASGGKDIVGLLREIEECHKSRGGDYGVLLENILSKDDVENLGEDDSTAFQSFSLLTLVMIYSPEELSSVCSFIHQFEEANIDKGASLVDKLQDGLLDFIGNESFNENHAKALLTINDAGKCRFEFILDIMNSEIGGDDKEERRFMLSADDKKRLILGLSAERDYDEDSEYKPASLLKAATKLFVSAKDEEDKDQAKRMIIAVVDMMRELLQQNLSRKDKKEMNFMINEGCYGSLDQQFIAENICDVLCKIEGLNFAAFMIENGFVSDENGPVNLSAFPANSLEPNSKAKSLQSEESHKHK